MQADKKIIVTPTPTPGSLQAVKIREDNGKICNVGEIFKERFYKRVKTSKHLYLATNSWGIDSEVFNDIIKIQCNEIRILDDEDKVLYVCSPQDYLTYGTYLHIKPHRAQIFLNRKYFEKVKNYQPKVNKIKKVINYRKTDSI